MLTSGSIDITRHNLVYLIGTISSSTLGVVTLQLESKLVVF